MPPKLASGTLIARMQNATHNLYELLDEFNTIYETKPQIERLSHIFTQVESKYRKVKQQLEDIADRLIDEGASTEDEASQANRKFGKDIKADYLQIAEKFALYENECSTPKQESAAKQFDNAGSLEAMTAAVTKMAKSLEVKSNPSGLERLSVPSWDGARRTYATFKKEFNHWMMKYKQDEEEQLQRFRKAMPKGWWSDQVTTCKSITQAWSILDVEFEDKRKLMDSLLTEINDLKPIKRDSKSLMSFSTTVRRYVNDMEDNDCSVTKSTESPFFMSQLLSKLDPKDNVEYGREMQRQRKSETVTTLIEWLHQEANLRSRGRRDDNNTDDDKADKQKRSIFYRRSDSHAVDSAQACTDDDCILGCPTKHLLQTCTIFQSLTVSQRWDIVKQNKRCRKCLRLHHTNDCQKADGTSCDKCTKNHHRLLHSEKKENLLAPSFIKPPAISNNNAQTSARSEKTKSVAGLCPIQKIKALDDKGTSVELLAMLDSGSNTSLLLKSAAKRLNLSGSRTHLTMNLAGGSTRSEESDLLEITIMPTNEQSIKKTLSVYTVQKPCSSAKTVSKKLVESYKHLKQVSDEIHLAGGTVDLLIGTDFADAFVDIHSITGETGEPIAKKKLFRLVYPGTVPFNVDDRKHPVRGRRNSKHC